jgi:hypothetical protein
MPTSPGNESMKSRAVWRSDLWRIAVVAVAAVLFAGCAGYKVGPSNGTEAGSRSIEFRPPVNHTLEPRVSEALSHSLRKHIQRDGTYRLDTKGNGDVIVTSTVTEYNRQGMTFVPNDTLTVRDYRVQLLAHINAYDRVTGKTLVNREFRGHTTVRVGRDQASAERQALPLLTDDLARAVTSALADGEW